MLCFPGLSRDSAHSAALKQPSTSAAHTAATRRDARAQVSPAPARGNGCTCLSRCCMYDQLVRHVFTNQLISAHSTETSALVSAHMSASSQLRAHAHTHQINQPQSSGPRDRVVSSKGGRRVGTNKATSSVRITALKSGQPRRLPLQAGSKVQGQRFLVIWLGRRWWRLEIYRQVESFVTKTCGNSCRPNGRSRTTLCVPSVAVLALWHGSACTQKPRKQTEGQRLQEMRWLGSRTTKCRVGRSWKQRWCGWRSMRRVRLG